MWVHTQELHEIGFKLLWYLNLDDIMVCMIVQRYRLPVYNSWFILTFFPWTVNESSIGNDKYKTCFIIISLLSLFWHHALPISINVNWLSVYRLYNNPVLRPMSTLAFCQEGKENCWSPWLWFWYWLRKSGG